MTEDQFQAACWQWVWNNYLECRHVLWAVPNGGGRSIVDAVKLQATGVLSGVHDMHLLWDGQFYTFEFKVGDNQLTTTTTLANGRKRYGQREWGEAIAKQGGVWFEVRCGENGRELDYFKNMFNGVLAGKYKRCALIKINTHADS